jgi:1-phosphatidylinositol phosphodiesterase
MPGNNWMGLIGGVNPNITKMAIPGTHDSATGTYNGGIPMVKCQHRTITDQLNLGVRALDIRVGTDSHGVVQTYHGSSVQVTFNSVLTDINNFLGLNGNEFVILMLKNEHGADSSIAVNALVDQVVGVNGANRVYQRSNTWPDLAQVPGRVLVFSRMANPAGSHFDTRGWGDDVNYQLLPNVGLTANCNLRIQDFWKFPFESNKQDAVQFSVRKAQYPVTNDELFLNFCSYASFGRDPDNFGREFNDWLRANVTTGRGVICVDAVDAPIADHIVGWNGTVYARPTTISSATIAGHRCDGLVGAVLQCTRVCQRRGSIGNPHWHYCTGCHKIFCDTCAAGLVSWQGITRDKKCDRFTCGNRTARV